MITLKSIIIFIALFFIKLTISIEPLKGIAFTKMGNKEVLVSRNDKFINVTIQNSIESCMIQDPEYNETVNALAYSEKKIIVWYTKKLHHILGIYKYIWQIYFVEPKHCTYISFVMDNLMFDHPNHLDIVNTAQALLVKLGFDLPTCLDCRSIGKGQRIPLIKSFGLETSTADQTRSEVSKVSKDDKIGGYLWIIKFDNCSTIMRRLDPKFRVIGERLMFGSVEAYSLEFGKISVCYSADCVTKRRPFICEFLHHKTLYTVSSIPIHHFESNFDHIRAFIRNLPGNEVFVTTIYERNCANGTEPVVYFGQRLHISGRINKPNRVIRDLPCGVHDFESVKATDVRHCLADTIFKPEAEKSCPVVLCLKMYCFEVLDSN